MADRADPVEEITAACPRPVRRPVMLQGWIDLGSIHWPYDPEVVQRLLPPGFTVDTFDGRAWVGLLPFRMRRVRAPGLPAFGRMATFPETNVRTYLVDPSGRRGVWFLSLDIDQLVPVLVARATYRLPYCWSHMTVEARGDRRTWTASRRWPRRPEGARTRIDLRIGAPIAPDEVTPFEHFVSARWALGSTMGRRLLWADVDHPPWDLHRAELLALDDTLVTSAGLPRPEGEPQVLWSPGVEVRIGRPRLLPSVRSLGAPAAAVPAQRTR